ncbi:hypothetical protein VNO78_16097 [Psophocarpus tetragonolobus]|uniref:Uncharacterized protein n=1 Tax=Psophocarpus tetragonolobus TaxID=3891 RepID=A0AAN9SFP5_PSOTE
MLSSRGSDLSSRNHAATEQGGVTNGQRKQACFDPDMVYEANHLKSPKKRGCLVQISIDLAEAGPLILI